MVAFVDNSLILRLIKVMCLLNVRGPVAFVNQLHEVTARHPEDMHWWEVIENLLFVSKVAI